MTDRSLDTLIDEAALGLADDADIERLEQLAQNDPAIAARLEKARHRFSELDDTADDVPLPDGFWDRVALHLGPSAEQADDRVIPADNVVQLSTVQRSLAKWRGAALGGMAAALLMGFVLGWTMLQTAQPVVVAVLLNAQGEAIALVESRPDNTTQVTLLERPDVPPNQVMQVWTKPEDDGLPVSLGLLTTGLSRVLTIEGLPPPTPQQLYEITVEPAGGSPTNLPTGPILGKGLAKAPVI
jgi:anti-sigma-K factor RskA